MTFETLDACCGEVRSVAEFLARRKSGRPSNPITGPIFVEGAQPGDTLAVEILKVELGADGFQALGPNRSIVAEEVDAWRCYAFHVSENRIRFPNGLQLLAEPVIGQFGNAPAGAPTFHAKPWGGNLDVPAACVGARLYVPVQVEGALFSLGDVHACQGDGEVVGSPEIGARVTVQFELLKYRHSEWCMIEDANAWHSLCSAATEAEAARLATLQNARFIERTAKVEFGDALILLTLIGKLSIARTGTWGDHEPVVCASFSKERLQQATASYSRSH